MGTGTQDRLSTLELVHGYVSATTQQIVALYPFISKPEWRGMAKWWECSVVHLLRGRVERRLTNLPPSKAPKGQSETAEEFWRRVEQAGKLVEAIALYDKLAAEYFAWISTPRETKKAFAERIEREGRRAEADRLR